MCSSRSVGYSASTPAAVSPAVRLSRTTDTGMRVPPKQAMPCITFGSHADQRTPVPRVPLWIVTTRAGPEPSPTTKFDMATGGQRSLRGSAPPPAGRRGYSSACMKPLERIVSSEAGASCAPELSASLGVVYRPRKTLVDELPTLDEIQAGPEFPRDTSLSKARRGSVRLGAGARCERSSPSRSIRVSARPQGRHHGAPCPTTHHRPSCGRAPLGASSPLGVRACTERRVVTLKRSRHILTFPA
jgi:hypothetical protein